MSYQAASNQPVLQQTIRKALRRTTTAIALLGLPGIALAGPEDGEVVRGDADIAYGGNTTTIDQHTNNAVINWQTFNVDTDEFVIFNQLDSSSVVLNRVLSSDASYILGQIEANGQVFLLNPNGIFFGDGAVLDVQGFLGSTLDIDDDDFMAGDYSFERADNAAALGQVVNDGSITAGEGGYVVLAGDFTENNGLISAQGGTAALVSGNALTLDLEGDGLVSFAVDEATLAGEAGVHNAGQIIADGGMVVMTARVAHEVTSTVVNNEGLVRARSIEEQGGEIYLVGNGGNVENSGTLDADGENADGGVIGLHATHDIVLADGGVQTADGDAGHDGGTVRAIAADHLDFQADNLISATGGNDGGFVEVSGHGSIALRGMVDVGRGGTYLIDPTSINIVSGSATGSFGTVGVNLITDQLDLGVNVIVAASNQITATATALNATGSGDLTLGIGNMSAGTGGSCIGLGSSLCFGPNPTFNPGTGGTINVSGMAIDIAGNLDLIAQAGSLTAGSVAANTISAFADNVTLGNVVATGNMNIGSSASRASVVTVNGLASAGGDISVWASGASAGIEFTDAVTATGNISMHANATNSNFGSIIVGDDGVNFSGSVVSAGGSVTLDASGGFNGGNVYTGAITGGASITITGFAGNGAGGEIRIGDLQTSPSTVFTPANVTASTGNITITSDRSGISVGNVTATTGSVSLDAQFVGLTAGSISAGGNVTTTAGEHNMSAATITAGGTATISGSGGISHSIAGITAANVNGTFTPSGSGSLNININNVTANGTGTDGNVNLSMLDLGAMSTGTLNIGNINATGNITLSAFDGAISAGGNISVTDGINASGLVDITALGNGVAEGNVTITTATLGGVAISGNGINITASGRNSQSVGGSGGSVDITGQVLGGTGAVTLSATGVGGIGAAGNVQVSGNSSAGQISGQSISISANGVNGGGRIDLGSGAPESSFQAAALTATGGNVSLTAVAGEGVINAGTISATGDVTIDNQVGQGHVHIGDYVAGSLTPATITAGGNFTASIGGSITAFDVGTISAGSNLTLNLENGTGHSFDTLTAGGLLDVNLNAISLITLNNLTGGTIDLNLPTVGLTLGNVDATVGGITISGSQVSISDSLVTAPGAISLTALNSFATYNDFSGSAFSASFGGAVSGRNITFGNITATSGDVTVLVSNSGGSAALTVNSINAGNAVSAIALGSFNNDLTVNNNVTAGAGVILNGETVSAGSVSAGDNVNITGDSVSLTDVFTSNGNISLIASGSFNAGNVNVTNNVETQSGSINISATQHTVSTGSDGNVTIGGSVIGTGGDIQIGASNTAGIGGANVSLGGAVLTPQNVTIDAGGGIIGSDLVIGSTGQFANFVTLNAPIDVTNSLRVWSNELNGASVGTIGSSLSPITTVSLNTTLITSGDVSIYAGSITGSSLHIGQSGLRVGDIFINTDISVSGDVSMWASNAGNITIGGVQTTTGAITLTGASIAASTLSAGSDISISATTSGAFAGDISIGGSGVTAGGNVTMTAAAASYGGNITLAGGISAGGLASLTASGGGFSSGGVVSVGNGILADSVSVTASGPDGHILIENASGIGIQAANNITLTATGTRANGGRIEIGSGNPEFSFTAHDLVASNGDITVSATGPSNTNGGVFVAGDISAAGSVTLTADGGGFGGGHIHLGDYSNSGGVFTAAGITAGNGVAITIRGGGDARIDAADISGSDVNVNVTAPNAIESGNAAINVGNVTTTGSGTLGNLVLEATFGGSGGNADISAGTLDATRNVAVDATGGSAFGSAAVDIGAVNAGGSVDVYAGAILGDTITINGNVTAGSDVFLWNRTDGNITVFGSVFGGGAVDIWAEGVSSNQGLVDIQNNITGSSVDIRAAGGLIDIGSGSREFNYTAGDITATTGNIILSLTGNTLGVGGGIVVAGDLVATSGNVTVSANTGQGHIHLGDYANSGATFTAANVTAGGLITLNANGSIGAVDAGSLSASGSINVSTQVIDITNVFTTTGNVTLTASGSASGHGDVTVTNNVETQNGTVQITGVHHTTSTAAGGNISIGGIVSAQGGNATISASDALGSGSGGSMVLGGVTATGTATITANDGGPGTGGNITITSSGVHGDGGISITAGNTGGSANVEVNGTILTPNNVTITASGGIVGNEFVVDTSAGGVSGLTVNGFIQLDSTATGDVIIWATNGGSVDISGSIDARTNIVDINAGGSTAGGLVTVGGPINGGGGVNIDANGPAGNIEIGTSTSGFFTGAPITATSGAITLTAVGGNSGGHIYAGSLNAGLNMDLLTSGSNGSTAANIRLGNADSTGALTSAANATAGGTISVTTTAATIGGNLEAGTLSAGGDLLLDMENASLIDLSALTFVIANNFSLIGNTASTYNLPNVTAQNIVIDVTPAASGSVSINTGNLTANGTTGTADGNVSVLVDAGANSGGTITVGTVNAINDLDLTVGSSPTTAQTGNISAASLTAGGSLIVFAPDNVTTGTLSGGPQIFLSGQNTVTVNGGITGGGLLDINASGSIGNAGSIEIAGNISAGTINITVSGSQGRIDLGTGASPEFSFNGADLNATAGGVSLNADGSNSGGGVINVGSVTATGGVGISASGGAGGGHIHIGDYVSGVLTAGNISAGASIGLFANSNGAGTLNSGALVDVGNVSNTAGSIIITANANGGSGSGAINGGNVNAGDVLATAALNINATGANGGGNIGFNSAQGAGVIMTASGDSLGGDINGTTVTGTGTSNDVSLNAIGSAGGGGITLNGAVSQRDLTLWTTGGNLSIGTGNLSASGSLNVNANGGGSHVLTDVTAGTINMLFTPSSGGTINVTTGLLTAGTGGTSNNINVNVNPSDPSATGNLSIAGATANSGNVNLSIGDGLSGLGSLTATGNITAGGIVHAAAPTGVNLAGVSAAGIDIYTANGAVVTGALTASNSTGAAFIKVNTEALTGGDISIGGPVTVNGTATSTNPRAADLSLVTGFGGSNTITVSGDISVTGAAANFTFSDQGVSETGFVGETNIRIDAGSNGAVSLANVALDGVGRGELSVNGDQVGVGSLTLNLGNGSFTQSFTTSCGGTCNLTNTQTMTSGGFLNVSFGSFGATGTSLTLGDINITGPGANVDIGQFQTITGGLVNITASGFDYMAGSTGTLEGSTVDYSQTVTNGGDAALHVSGASTATISFGAITLDGAGSASLELFGDVITVGSLGLTASGGTFTVTGSPAFGFGGSFAEGTPGPRIDEGTITGGLTRVDIGGTGSIAASQVDVLGSINATAAGAAEVFVNANNISVSGDITASATANVIKDGTVDDTFFDSDAGASFHISGTVFSSLGAAHVDLLGSSAGTVSAGNISMNGAQAGGTVMGGTLNLGNITLTATGGSIDVAETTTNLDTGTSESFILQGPALINGVQLGATGTLSMGSLNVSGVGAGGALLEAGSVSMGSVNINVTDAGYQVLDPDVFGSSTNSFTLGDALFDLDTATASINGNVVVSGTQMAHVGGNINATGTVTVSGTNGVNQPIREEVNYLNNIDDGNGASIGVASPLSLSGSAVSLSASNGSLELSNTTITTVNDLTLTAGAGIDLDVPTLSIGGSIIVNGPSLNLGGGSGANYDLVTNVGEINLGTVGTVIIDNTASTGTTTLNQSGTAASLTITDGGTLALGTAISADTISLSASTVSLGTNSINATNLLALSGNGVDLGGNNLAASVVDVTASGSITGVGGISAGTLTLDAPAITGETISLAADSLTMGTGSVTATNSINLDLGSTAAIGGATFVAPTLGVSATAPSLTLQTNVGTVNVGSVESLTIDNFANTGTTTLNQAGTAANLTVFDGGTLTLGTALEAGGIALSGSALDLGSHDVTASGSLDLLTSTSLNATGTLTGASILVEAWSAPGLQLTTNTGDLSIYGNGSVSVDNTAHTGTANVSLGGEVLDAVEFAFGGDATFLSGFNAGSFTVLGAGLDLGNQMITTSGDMTFALGGDLAVTGANLDAGGVLDVDAANIVNGGALASITADAVLMTASGSINLSQTTLDIGSGSLADATGDTELMELLAGEGVTSNQTGPNAVFWADTITLDTLNFGGDYLQLNADQLTITGTVTATNPDTVVQLAPLDVTADIGVEDGTGGTGTVNYSNAAHLSHFQGLTVAIGGTGHDGAINIGANGQIDIGDTNFFAVTQGEVSGLSNVLSTGIVKDLDDLLGIGFETPQTEEIDSSQDTSNELQENFGNDPADSIDEDDLSDDDDEGDEEGEDTDDDVVEEEEDDSLIRQDTAEEELMCE